MEVNESRNIKEKKENLFSRKKKEIESSLSFSVLRKRKMRCDSNETSTKHMVHVQPHVSQR